MAAHAGFAVTESDPDGVVGAESGSTRPGATGLWAEGPVGSFGELYLGSYPGMVRLARVLVDSPETAEDLVQDAFVRLHRHWGALRDPRAYLHRSVVNACRSHHRRTRRERARTARPEHRPGQVPPAPGVETGPGTEFVDGVAEQGRTDDADVLGAALGTLPYRQRAALVLRYYADLPDAEIAVVLGCRPGTVASLVHRGLQRLREVVDHD
jgi:RNA polymerase sigma factor (sigma-70 family)